LLADFLHLLFESQALKLLYGQARHQFDASLEDIGDPNKFVHLFLVSSLNCDGSSTPQCAVTGWPGQTGHTSPAALSQTVNTKSMTGAPGFAYSFQSLLCSPSVEKRIRLNVSSANAFGAVAGWLPAEKPLNFPRPT
jgi:hypothetical protein